MPLAMVSLYHQCSFPQGKMNKNGRLMIGVPPESIGVACESG